MAKKKREKIEMLPWRICNNSVHIIELMFIENPYAGSIFIDGETITAICSKGSNTRFVKDFPVGTNIKKVEFWIKERLKIL